MLALFFGFGALFSFGLWQASSGPETVESLHDYLPRMLELRDGGRLGEAIALGNFVETQPDLPNHAEIVQLKNELELEQASWLGKSKRFLRGFLFGDTTSLAGMGGTVVSDFLVIGDIRDLSKQGLNWVNGEETDYFITTLSAVGLVASVATLVPEPGSTAGGATAQPVLSLLKALKRVGALSGRFATRIVKRARRAIRTGSAKPFKPVFTSMRSLAKRAPNGTIPMLTKHVDDVDELKTISRWVSAAPHETVALMQATGRGGIATLKAAGAPSRATLIGMLRIGGKVVSKTRVPLRATKFVYRGRIDEMRDVAVDWLVAHPSKRYLVLLLAGLSGLLCCISVLAALVNGFRVIAPTRWRPVAVGNAA